MLAEQRHRGPDETHWRGQVDLERVLPVIIGELRKRGAREGAGGVYEDVEPAGPAGCMAYDVRGRLLTRQVGGEERRVAASFADLPHRLLELFATSPDDDHGGA